MQVVQGLYAFNYWAESQLRNKEDKANDNYDFEDHSEPGLAALAGLHGDARMLRFASQTNANKFLEREKLRTPLSKHTQTKAAGWITPVVCLAVLFLFFSFVFWPLVFRAMEIEAGWYQ